MAAKMNLTYKIPESKRDITTKQYLEISKLYADAKENEVEVNEHEIIAVCLNIPIELVSKLPIDEYKQASEAIANALKEDAKMCLTFTHEGVKYGFIPDIENITIGEYSALDDLMKNAEENAYKILNVLYRPIVKEKFYKSWFSKEKRGRYSIQSYDHSNDSSSFESLPCEIYESSLLFFLTLGSQLVNATLKYTREELVMKEAQDSEQNGDGIKRLIHTLQQQESTLMKSTKNLQIKYCLD